MAASASKHVFVINQLGQSAHRRGPFESAQAAREWVAKKYPYPCWLVPAEYVGVEDFLPLDKDGNQVREG